jgi:hypothetical protein
MFEQRRCWRGATREDKVRAVLRLDAANGRCLVLAGCCKIALFRQKNQRSSAHVPGLPVYAAADTRAKAEQAMLLGAGRSQRKARSSKLNGRLGGRAAKVASASRGKKTAA